MAEGETKGDKDVADFAKAVDSAAVCATEDAAGGHGIDERFRPAQRRLPWATDGGAISKL